MRAPLACRAVLLAALVAGCGQSGRGAVERVRLESRAMGGPWRATVVLPASYAREADRRFPALYLLHGAHGEDSSWVRNSPLAGLLSSRDLIVVCPNGRVFGWYVDSERRADSKVETHLVEELIPYVDARFRTVASREGRAIAGYSMGGHGALTLAARRPELFCSASSMSGIFDIVRWRGHWGLEGAFGSWDPAAWRERCAMGRAADFAGRASGVRLLVDCGRGDVAWPENRELHEELERLGVRHVYREREGRHDWRYWSAHLAEHLDFHLESFAGAGEARAEERVAEESR